MLPHFAGIFVGSIIGGALRWWQEAGLRRQEEHRLAAKPEERGAANLGQEMRIASLLVILVVTQLTCPMFFRDGMEWWVSGSLVAGYGGVVFHQSLKAKKIPPAVSLPDDEIHGSL